MVGGKNGEKQHLWREKRGKRRPCVPAPQIYTTLIVLSEYLTATAAGARRPKHGCTGTIPPVNGHTVSEDEVPALPIFLSLAGSKREMEADFSWAPSC